MYISIWGTKKSIEERKGGKGGGTGEGDRET